MDEDFARACHGHRNVLQRHLFGAAEPLYTHSPHLASTTNIDDRTIVSGEVLSKLSFSDLFRENWGKPSP
jgi:hypothetical protein